VIAQWMTPAKLQGRLVLPPRPLQTTFVHGSIERHTTDYPRVRLRYRRYSLLTVTIDPRYGSHFLSIHTFSWDLPEFIGRRFPALIEEATVVCWLTRRALGLRTEEAIDDYVAPLLERVLGVDHE
jgi:hypothetical protein